MRAYPGAKDHTMNKRVKDKNEDLMPRKCINKRNKQPQESILERFDRLANAHIEKRRANVGPVLSLGAIRKKAAGTGPIQTRIADPQPPKLISRTLASSMSNVDVTEGLDFEETDELAEAIDKLLQAEEAMRFTETIIAAEAAVATVPPEFAEEAALAVAQKYQTRKVYTIKEEIPGETIIEVLGYLGIRKRQKQMATEFCDCY